METARRWRVGVLTVWVVCAAAAVWKLRSHALDDFFVTYRFAENLATGRGFAFNPGERAFVTSAPGWALILGALRWATRLPVTFLGMAGSALAWLTVSWVITREAEDHGRPVEGYMAGTLLITCAPLWTHGGSEIPAALATVLCAARLAEKRPAISGLLCGFAAWLRPDFALAAPLVAFGVCRGWRARGRCLAAAAAVFATGLVAARSWFGVFLPITAAAKRAHAVLYPAIWPSGSAFWASEWGFVRDAYAGKTMLLFVVLAAAGAFLAWRRAGSAVRTLLGLAALLAAAYPLLGVPFFTWYALPQLTAAIVAAAFAAVAVVGRAARAKAPWRWPLVAASTVAMLIWPAAHLARWTVGMIRPFDFPLGAAYRDAGEWIAAHAAPGDEVSAIEVGEIAFYSGIPMRDLLGLTSPENLPTFAAAGTRAVLRSRPTRFVVWASHLPQALSPEPLDPATPSTYRAATRLARGGLIVTILVRADPP